MVIQRVSPIYKEKVMAIKKDNAKKAKASSINLATIKRQRTLLIWGGIITIYGFIFYY